MHKNIKHSLIKNSIRETKRQITHLETIFSIQINN